MSKNWTVDLTLTAVLLLLMGYSLIGEVLHEWLGIAMLILLLLHHAANRVWWRNLTKGRFTPGQAARTALNLLLLASVLGSLFSGLVISQHVLDFLPPRSGSELARVLHLPCAFWSFLLMGLHLGLHWEAVMGLFACLGHYGGKLLQRPAPGQKVQT